MLCAGIFISFKSTYFLGAPGAQGWDQCEEAGIGVSTVGENVLLTTSWGFWIHGLTWPQNLWKLLCLSLFCPGRAQDHQEINSRGRWITLSGGSRRKKPHISPFTQGPHVRKGRLQQKQISKCFPHAFTVLRTSRLQKQTGSPQMKDWARFPPLLAGWVPG